MTKRAQPKKTTYGRVTVTPSGKYFRIRWREQNRTVERSSTSFEEACRLAQEVNARIESGQLGSPEGTFAALAAAATARGSAKYRDYSQDSWNNIRSLVRHHIVPAFEHRKARQVTAEELQQHLESLLYEQELSKHTVGRVRTILINTCALGVERGVWPPAMNPARNLRVPRSAPGDENDIQLQTIPQERIPTEEEVQRLLDVAWEANPMHGFILEMAARSGLRWSEIMGLRPEDFNLDNRTVTIERTRRVLHSGEVVVKGPKTKAGRRTTVVPTSSVELVRSVLNEATPGKFIVTTSNGTVLLRTNFQRNLDKYRSKAEFPMHLSVHSLRHFFGSYAGRVGLDVSDISRIMGHANPRTTQTLYMHGDAQSVDRAKDLLQ